MSYPKLFLSNLKDKAKYIMVMQMRWDKCYPGREKWVKIPLLPENVGKKSLNYLGTLRNP